MTDKKQKLMYGITAFHLLVDLACITVLFAVVGWYTFKFGFDYFFGTFFGSFRRGLCFFALIDAAACLIEVWDQRFFKFHGVLNIINIFTGVMLFAALHIPLWMGVLFIAGPAVPFAAYLFLAELLGVSRYI